MYIHLTVTRCCYIGPVNINTHGIIAISDKSVFFIYQINFGRDVHTDRGIVFLSIVSVRKISICTGVVYVPAINVFTSIFSIISTDITGLGSINGKIAVLEVINYFRCLAKTDVGNNSLIFLSADHRSKGTAGKSGTFITSGKLITNYSTKLFIRKSINNISVFMGYGITAFVGGNFDRKIHCVAITDNDGFISESDFGEHNGYRGFTDHFAVINELYDYITFFAVGCENAIIDCAEGIVNQLPCSICRNINDSTYHISTDHIKLYCRIRCIVLIFSRNMSLIELSVSGSCRNETNTGCRRTEAAIGRRVVYLQFFTGTLRNESGRSTTIAVSRKYTASRNHYLRTLVHIHACREGRLTTVVKHHNYLTISGNTYHGARSGIVMSSFVLICAVFYYISAGNRNNSIFPAIKVGRGANLGHFNLRNVGRSGIAIFIKVLVDNHASRESNIAISIPTVTRVKHDLAIQHHEAERFAYTICRITGIPRQAAVHYTNYLTFHILVNPIGLIEHGASLILGCVHFSVSGDYTNIGIVHVRLHDMKNLTIVTCIVIQNDFGFGNTGSIVPVGLGDEIVVLIRARRCIVIVINTGCKCSKRYSCKNTHDHHNNHQKRETPLKLLLHVQTPFFIILRYLVIVKKRDRR